MRSREEVTVDGLRYVRTDGQWFAHPEGASWRIPQDDDKSRMLDRIRELESPPRPEPVAIPPRITEALQSLAKGWRIIAAHADYMDGEFSNALDDVKRHIERLHEHPPVRGGEGAEVLRDARDRLAVAVFKHCRAFNGETGRAVDEAVREVERAAIAAALTPAPVPPVVTAATSLVAELTSLLNRYSAENGSNTPDFILADFLRISLAAFDGAVVKREHWYGRSVTAASEVRG